MPRTLHSVLEIASLCVESIFLLRHSPQTAQHGYRWSAAE